MYSYNPYYGEYLAHYGVLGMKWGVRRFQNKDGTLTPKGLKRLRKTLLKANASYARNSNKKYNSADDNDIIVKKGEKQYRVATEGEKLDNRIKYLSNKEDNLQYKEDKYLIRMEQGKRAKNYVYEAKKDLKIASEKKVTDYLLNKYFSDKKAGVKQFNDLMDELDMSFLAVNGAKVSKSKVELAKVFNDSFGPSIRKKVFETNLNDIMNHFEKEGYDGIFDYVDGHFGYTKSPIILSTPINKLKLVDSSEDLGIV